MCDFTLKAFKAAQTYRTPAILLANGFVGQMMEPVRFPETAIEPPRPKPIELNKRTINAGIETANAAASY